MRIERMKPDELSQEQRSLYDSVTTGRRASGPQHFALTAEDGSLNGPFNAFLLSPDLGEALQNLGAALRYRGTLSDRGREIAILLVAARSSSDFEQMAHEAIGRSLGLSERDIAALREQDTSSLDGHEALIGRVTLAVLDGDLDDADWDEAKNALGADGVFELTTLVGYYATLALQLRIFRV